MSQAKVDRYKAEKANRKKNLKREKAKRGAAAVCGVIVCAAVVCWIGYSAFGYFHSDDTTDTVAQTEINLDSLNAYLDGIQSGAEE